MKQYRASIVETEDSIYEYDIACMKCKNSDSETTHKTNSDPIPVSANQSSHVADNNNNLFTLLVCFKFAESYL